MKLFLLPFFILFLISHTHFLTAQEERQMFDFKENVSSPRNLWWVNLGIGGGRGTNGTGTILGLTGSINKPLTTKFLATARVSIFEDMDFDYSPADPEDRFWDAGVLGGLYTKGGAGYLSVSAGVGLSGGQYEGSDFVNEKVAFTTFGFPIEFQAFLTLRNIGIGVIGLGNVNLERSSWGLCLSLQFGMLK